MRFFLRWLCPIVAAIIFIGGLWLWIGGTYFENHNEDKSVIIVNDNPESLLMNIFGLYFFLKCAFCSFVLFILSYWLLRGIEKEAELDHAGPS